MKSEKLELGKAKSLVEESAYFWKGNPKIFWPSEKITNNNPIAVDLFCGMGGLSLGFEQAGFNIALGLDIHEPSVNTFRHSHPQAAAILGDITKMLEVDGENSNNVIENTLEKVLGGRNVDVLMAGIPCQGFSLQNRKRSVLDERNYLFIYFMEAAKIIDPAYILIENVSGIKTLNNGQFIEDIEEAIGELHYTPDHKMLNAVDFGVPQLRKRIFFMGAKDGYQILWPDGYPEFRSDPRTVSDAIFDLPHLHARQNCKEYTKSNNLTNYQKMMRENCDVLWDHQAPHHMDKTIERIKNTAPGEPMYENYTQRIRLNGNDPSPTIVAGGIRPQFQLGHPKDNRGLTVRERCRIQSIPDNVKIYGGMVQGRVQTGNAVPPLLAKAIGDMIYFTLNIPSFRKKIEDWSKENFRHFPWRTNDVTPYDVLVAEILLRKTRAENVVPIYETIREKYPTPAHMAIAKIDELEKVLKPIGLYHLRAKRLKKIGETLIQCYFGQIPKNFEKLIKITGVGRYIANGTLMFGYNIKRPIVDANIERIFRRAFDTKKPVQIHTVDNLWKMSDLLIPKNEPKTFAWGILDFGSIVCNSSNPNHGVCPIKDFCKYVKKES